VAGDIVKADFSGPMTNNYLNNLNEMKGIFKRGRSYFIFWTLW